MMDLRKAQITELDQDTLRPRDGLVNLRFRRLARYKGETVLLDPKDYGENPDDSTGEKVYARVKELASDLARLLPTLPFGIEAGTLECKGWYEDQSTSQFYLVYSLPPECEEPCKPKCLSEIFRSSRPSVGARIGLARSLALITSKVHENGWLHKGIRSDHVLFFPRGTGRRISIRNVRLVGFDFARKDRPHEYSEKPMCVHGDFLPTKLFLRLS